MKGEAGYPIRMTTTMSAEDRLELVETAKRLEPLTRAARWGRTNGLGYVVFGGLSLLLSISSTPDWISLLIGAVLIGAGLVERSQSARLALGDAVAPKRMAQAEIALLGAILFGCAIKLAFPSSASAELGSASGELAGLGLDVTDLIDSVTRLVYAVVMVVSILYQGGMARYFLKRRNDVAVYLASPDWARSLVQSMNRPNSV
jgi:hypothetical protein